MNSVYQISQIINLQMTMLWIANKENITYV